jgi:para-aminobenzoate synthetase component 1
MAYYILKSYKLKLDPLDLFCALKRRSGHFFLDSSLNQGPLGRYSFLGFEPFYILKTKDQNPFPRLRKLLSRYKICAPKDSLPFLGGAVGYLAYDLGLGLEKKIKPRAKTDTGIPGCFFAFYNKAVIIDHLKKLLYIFSAGLPEASCRAQKFLCEENFKKVYALVSGTHHQKRSAKKSVHRSIRTALKSNFTKDEYVAAVNKAKQYIREGDIYQVNLSQEFSAKTTLSAFEIYRRLRQISPAYFNAYLDCADFQILSSSPERFLCSEGKSVTTRPMKGTRPRGDDKKDDQRLKKELLVSPKDRAELMMIVDLERNDLGRVCTYDSVRVSALRTLEEYNTVFQTTATITGRLYKGKDRIDLLRACFPGGSITGCPKIRAMEIIDELEPHRRSIYTGCLGYLSFNGNMDFNILIRSILKKDNTVKFGVGGGIVADSLPQEEYRETLVKARAMKEAIS